LNEPLSGFTSYLIGGPAEALSFPQSDADVCSLLAYAHDKKIPLTVLGAGTNVLIGDCGIEGIVCILGHCDAGLKRIFRRRNVALHEKGCRPLCSVNYSGTRISSGASVLWDSLVLTAAQAGLGGLERLSGIPGSVGGAVYMNAGAFEASAFDGLAQFTAVSRDGKNIRVFSRADVKAEYRHVEGLDGHVILSAEWDLRVAGRNPVMAERRRVLDRRAEKQPLDLPSAGSVFKRPAGDFASRLIDAAGLKGRKVGGAEVSSKHAGFIVNTGGATAADVKALMGIVRSEVYEKFKIELELEQILLGSFGPEAQ
jgi:UDP-N-acetylmuramate dehydrogenase